MLRERDLKMIRHIEKYGFITIKQAHKIFFTDRRCGYDLARRRLAKLTEQGHMLSYMDYLSTNPEKIFYLKEKYKLPSRHTILIMDTYAEIVSLGAKIMYFEREQVWEESNRRSDGYVVFLSGEYLYEVFIEVIYHIGSDQKSRIEDMSNKYYKIISSNESSDVVSEAMNTDKAMPTNKVILIVNGDEKKQEIEDFGEAKIVNVNYNLSGISNILS